MRFHPAVEAWFTRRFPHGPTDAQARGWAAIASGQSTLIAAPTGSGKTLAAFLVCLDRLVREANAELTPVEPRPARTQVVYVSPLKALGVDIQQNLEAPLREISALCEELGYHAPDVRVAVRSGDTEASARAAMLRKPPDILITTPESLYLLLTADKSRQMLASARTVIVDEIHALARDKRGAHLALTLERLEHVAGAPLVRIGLSATQRPIELVARLLCGVNEGVARPCTIVDTGHKRALDLAIELPGSELSAVASTEHMNEVMDRVAKHVAEHRTTLVFVNTRRLAERCAHMLGERLGEERVAAHHGSLSKDRRLRVEQRLRAGELRAIVATASLELGIDVGPVELVCQIGSPRSIATLLQRVGRSGHHRFGIPVGRLYPLTRDELVECAAALRAVRGGRLDALSLPDAPLDVLCQQIVAECAAETWNEDALFALYRGAAPYAALSRESYEAALHLISEGVLTGRGVRAAYVQRDRVGGLLKGRRGARLSALTSGGAIPENADYRVIAEPDEALVGTINEDFAIESMVGDVFLLGSTSWRIRRVEKSTVRVEDAKGATPTIPFWLGEAPARTAELSDEVSTLRCELDAQLARGGVEAARAWLQAECGIDALAADEIARYLDAVRGALGLLPTRADLVVERFFDETGGMQLVVHSPHGGRINRALGLLLRKRFCTGFDFELQAAANDDAIVLSLGPQHSFPLDDMRGFLRPDGVREALVHAVIVTPMFAVRWRWNLNRSLVVLRVKGGKKNPPPIQRMEADDVMVAVFPALAQCQDNANGPREIPDHVLVRQTLHDCLHEAMDLDGLKELLGALHTGSARMCFRDTTEPSPLAHEILNSKPYTFLDDAPLEERRTRAVQTRRGLPVAARELAALDLAAIDRVRSEAERVPRDADELHDVLRELCICRPRDDWHAWFQELVGQGRALEVGAGLNVFWCTSERRALVAALLPRARFTPDAPLPAKLQALLMSEPVDQESAAVETLRGHLDTLGPTTTALLATQLGLDESTVLAALAQLELRGFALRGSFDPRLPQHAEHYCARRLLSRIHAYTHERLRRDIEPVSPQDFMRFLLRHQHLAPGFQLSGGGGVLQTIEQLQGYELAAGAWESDVLAARIERYRPEQLDALCLAGEVCWGRPSRNAAGAAQPQGSATLSRATPITLALRSDYGWLALAHTPPAPTTESQEPPLRTSTARVLATLRERGALFLNELAAFANLPADVLHEALWDGVARGLITADGFGALRNLLGPNPVAATAAHSARRIGLRRSAPRSHGTEGRWALAPSVPAATAQAPRPHSEELAEAAAGQLLARYGVVFRDLVTRDALACAAGIPYRGIAWALRRFEARGLVRGGRFVNGFVGEQFALPEAVELLRSVRRAPHDGKVIRINGCDPLNLTGLVLPGQRVPATRTNVFYVRDGARVSTSEASAIQEGAQRPSTMKWGGSPAKAFPWRP